MSSDTILSEARARAIESGLPYAGRLSPQEALGLVVSKEAILVDVRSSEERTFVGYVPDSVHVPWATGTALTRNPRFARELEAKLLKLGSKDSVVVFLCRSGKRSDLAAEVAAKSGFVQAFNIAEGFEGELDAASQRGNTGGWRHYGLPWVQD